MEKGEFVVLEGIDGSGTTTIAGRLVHHFREMEREVVSTYEPTSGPIGEVIRANLRAKEGHFNDRTMALLFMADREHHIRTVIQPALAENKVIICDRYMLSTLAYQIRQSEDRFWVGDLVRSFQRPSVTIFLETDPELALSRVVGRQEEPDRYEKLSKQEDAAKWYRHWMKVIDWPIIKVDSNQDLDSVMSDIILALKDHPTLSHI